MRLRLYPARGGYPKEPNDPRTEWYGKVGAITFNKNIYCGAYTSTGDGLSQEIWWSRILKGKLRELRAAYVQIEQVVPDVDSTQVFRNWLRDTQDSLSRFLITLTVMAAIRRIMTVLWPLVVALVAVSAV
jgi:hypothetical protein